MLLVALDPVRWDPRSDLAKTRGEKLPKTIRSVWRFYAQLSRLANTNQPINTARLTRHSSGMLCFR
jgi:hypothetical protein